MSRSIASMNDALRHRRAVARERRGETRCLVTVGPMAADEGEMAARLGHLGIDLDRTRDASLGSVEASQHAFGEPQGKPAGSGAGSKRDGATGVHQRSRAVMHPQERTRECRMRYRVIGLAVDPEFMDSDCFIETIELTEHHGECPQHVRSIRLDLQGSAKLRFSFGQAAERPERGGRVDVGLGERLVERQGRTAFCQCCNELAPVDQYLAEIAMGRSEARVEGNRPAVARLGVGSPLSGEISVAEVHMHLGDIGGVVFQRFLDELDGTRRAAVAERNQAQQV